MCTNEKPFLIITELMTNGALIDYLRAEKNRQDLTLVVMIDILAQIWFAYTVLMLTSLRFLLLNKKYHLLLYA